MTPGELRKNLSELWADIEQRDAYKDEFDTLFAAADAWDLDRARANVFKQERDAAEAQVDRIANGIAVLGEKNANLRKALKMLTFSPDGCPDTWPSPEAVAAVLLEMP